MSPDTSSQLADGLRVLHPRHCNRKEGAPGTQLCQSTGKFHSDRSDSVVLDIFRHENGPSAGVSAAGSTCCRHGSQSRSQLFSKALKDSNIAAYALTARGPMFENSTRRELTEAGIEFSLAPECTGDLCEQRGIIKGVVVQSYAKDELKLLKKEWEKLDRDININNGIMMVSGQDKGVMLRMLLRNFPSKYDFETIVFVDDDLKNVIAVADAASDLKRDVYVYHYTRYEDDVKAFLSDKKRQIAAAKAWGKIREAVCKHESMRWCQYPTS